MSAYQEEVYDRRSYGRFSMSELSASKLENKLSASQGSSSLNLADGFIGDEGCQLVADFLRENSSIRNLELRGNNITGQGLRILLPALKFLPGLKVLSLEWNSIENDVDFLAEALRFHTSLQVLDLRNNKIAPEGAAAIATLIGTSTSLQRIDLRWNELGPAGARAILAALKKPHALQSLEISGNKIPEELSEEIRKLVGTPPDKTTKFSMAKSDEEPKFASSRQELTANEISNVRQEARVNELEFLLEQEARRSAEIREDLMRELDMEKSKRNLSEETLEHMKEQNYRQTLENSNIQQDLEVKLNRTLNEKNQLIVDYESLQEQYNKLSFTLQENSRDFEDKLSQQQRLYRQLDESSRLSLERVKQDQLEETEELRKDYELQLSSSNESNRHLKSVRESLEEETKSLRLEIASLKKRHQEELGSLEAKVRQEEVDKFTMILKNTESRLKSAEELRENLTKKNQDLQRLAMETEHNCANKINVVENALNENKEEIAELQRQLQKANNNIESLHAENQAKHTNLMRVNAEKEDVSRVMQERQQSHMKKLENLYQEQTNERSDHENLKRELGFRVTQLEDMLDNMTRERDRAVKEYDTLQFTVQQRINSCIEETIGNHLRKLQQSITR